MFLERRITGEMVRHAFIVDASFRFDGSARRAATFV
jgi:hypothetical protein